MSVPNRDAFQRRDGTHGLPISAALKINDFQPHCR
jgi:hypothetical protein